MVHDPRVTSVLARLGGLYRDPSRVDRDVSILLKSSVGTHLIPGIAPLVENNGESCNCLVLQGTIGICFRGTTYQLLVDMYCPPGYPIRPPVVFVRLGGPNMYLKENHLHVGSDGKVYLPYLHEWKSNTHNLVELIVAMSSIFSADPPVFTRPPSQQQQQQQQQQQVQASQPTTRLSSTTNNVHNTPTTVDLPPPPAIDDVAMVENIIAQEAAEANRIAQIARVAEQSEMEQHRLVKAQQEWEEKKRLEIKKDVEKKIIAHLTELMQQTNLQIKSDQRDEKRLELSTEEKVNKQLKTLQKSKDRYTNDLATVNNHIQQIQEWLQDIQSGASNNGTVNNKVSSKDDVNNMVQAKYPLYEQMLQLSAENASLTDAMYFLDQALVRGTMDCTAHIKQVRKVAKRQFLVRAHLLKIQSTLSSDPTIMSI